MSVDRPTFHESWHRVAELRPRLRAAVQSYRQNFRGRSFHVLSDPANNQFFRVDESAYHFVALLDGKRTVAQAWDMANAHLADAAPTQGEVIQLLGQLFGSNLLHAELPPDSEQMFQRYRKRVRREVGSYLVNFLFARIPVINPQRLLDQWEPVVGWIFTPVGVLLWACLILAGVYNLAGHWEELWLGADPQVMLKGQNLVLLYFTFAVIKAIHESGHAFSCVHFGKKTGVPTKVHTIGMMLMVLMPVPYVDATSSWMLRSKWHRAFIGAAGMYVELAVAAICAIIWTHTGDPLLRAISYNAMVIASVSTLLFNANPLLRFDGYYILSDLLEIANLAQRSKQYLYYLARRYLFGVTRAHPTAHGLGERFWLVVYAVTSSIYRVFVSVAILLYISHVLFFIGLALALAALVGWAVVPVGKFFHYLMTHGELERSRHRAVAVTASILGVGLLFIGLVPMPDRDRADGVIEPLRLAAIHMGADGFVKETLPSGSRVSAGGPALLTAANVELEAEKRDLIAQIKGAAVKREMTRPKEKDTAAVQALTERIAALQKRLDRVNLDLASLTIRAPYDGVWVSPQAERLGGVYIQRGQQVGLVADPSSLILRVTTDQRVGPRITHDATVEFRIMSRPDLHDGKPFTGSIRKILSAGQNQLPSAALGYVAGGSMTVAKDDRTGTKSTEPFFEIQIDPDSAPGELHIGQRVVVRFSMPSQPLLYQWYRTLQQVYQQRIAIPT
jgi:putative peptide zinc metalloprotease protein